MPDVTVTIAAPAKVNLTLHVIGQRADGYHLLDSLVVFADVGDSLTMRPSDTLSLRVDGPESGQLATGQDNLVLKVAGLLPTVPRVAVTLTKNLPVSSGIGGGSADAAAAFRGFKCLADRSTSGTGFPNVAPLATGNPESQALAALGADIPVCVNSDVTRMRGIGDDLTPIPSLPPLWAVLVNPRVAVSTPAVFKQLATKSNAPMPDDIPIFGSARELIDWLSARRNDLEPPAIHLAPEIAKVLGVLHAIPACRLARMSGSGATCFGLFENRHDAESAALAISAEQTGWWANATRLGSARQLAMPQIR